MREDGGSREMGNSKTKQKITARDRAILDLKVQRDRLKQYQKRIDVVREREVQIAKEHLAAGKKDLALLALRKKKYQEGLLEKTNQQLLNLEQLTNQIEFAIVEQQVFAGLQQGNSILKEIQQEMSLEAVENLMEETAEAIAYQEEISRALSGKLTADDEMDLESELNDLIAAEMPEVPVLTQNEELNVEPVGEEEALESENEEKPAMIAA